MAAQLSPAEEYERLLAGLEPRQARFVREYLLDLNAAAAYRRAGYAPADANVNAARLMAKDSIRTAIQAGRAMLTAKLNVRAEDILREYRKLGFSDLGNYVTWGPDGVAMLSSDVVEPEHRGAIAEIQETITPQKDGAPIRRLAFKLHDKRAALDSLSKVLGMQRDSGESVNQQTLNALIAVVYALLEKHVPQQKLEPVVIELGRAIDGVFQK